MMMTAMKTGSGASSIVLMCKMITEELAIAKKTKFIFFLFNFLVI